MRMRVLRIGLASVLLLMVALLSSQGAPTLAQDGDGEREAIVDRVIAAEEMVDGLNTYRLYVSHSEAQAITLSLAGQTLELASAAELTEVRDVVQTEDGDNFSGMFTVVFSEAEQGQERSYTMNAEARLVDDLVYINASYEEASEDLPALSPGWQAFEAEEDLPGTFDQLDLSDYFNEEDDLTERRELLVETSTSITSEDGTLEDETPVEFVTISFEDQDFRDFMGSFTDEEEMATNPFASIFASEAANGAVTYVLALNEEGLLVQVEFAISLSVEELDVSTVSDQFPPGALLNLSLSDQGTEYITDINADIEPAEAPEIG